MIAPFYIRKKDLGKFKLESDFRTPNLTVYTKVFSKPSVLSARQCRRKKGSVGWKRAHDYKLPFDLHAHTITFEIHMHMSALVCVYTHKQIKISINQEVLQLHLNLNG